MQKKIEKILGKHLKLPPKDAPRLVADVLGISGEKAAATEIAKLCSEDKYDALQVQDAAWHDIQDKHLAALATAQAQVAQLVEALESCASGDEWKGTEALTESLWTPTQFAKQVCGEILEELSAAPKVVWSGNMPAWRGVSLDARLHHPLGVGIPDLPKHLRGKEFNVIVLEQGEGE